MQNVFANVKTFQAYEQFIILQESSSCQSVDLAFLSITQQCVYFAKLTLLWEDVVDECKREILPQTSLSEL